MPPGVPVACVGVDNARNAAVLAARILSARLIERYTRPEMGAVWTDQARMDAWLQVEVAAVEALAEQGVVPAEDAAASGSAPRSRSRRSREREKVTDHDMAAFVDVVAESVGEPGRWVHYGLTSSDVLDTALALQIAQAGEILVAGAASYRDALADARASTRHALRRPHARRARRAHHLRPEARRLRVRGRPQPARGSSRRSSGARSARCRAPSGTYAANGPEFEQRVLDRLGLRREDVSTQVVPRDRHAELLDAIALAGAGLERFAAEIRHLQRTEVREVEEPFRAGQKGSSAMPHKRNPIVSERITGHRPAAARLRAGRARERGALARARHLALVGRARGAAGRDDPARLRAGAGHPRGRGHDGPRRPHAREPRTPRTARCSRSARCSRWSRRAARATTPTGSSRRTPSAPGTRAPVPRAAGRGRARAGPRRGLRHDRIRASCAGDGGAAGRSADAPVGGASRPRAI